MSVLELKGDILQIISNIDNEDSLRNIREFAIKYKKNKKKTQFWDNYTLEERSELEKAFEESYDDSNGIMHEDMKKKHAKWLKSNMEKCS